MRCLVPDVSAGPTTDSSLYNQSYAYFTRAICRRSTQVEEEKPKTRVERAKLYMNGKLAQLSEINIRGPTKLQLRNIAIRFVFEQKCHFLGWK